MEEEEGKEIKCRPYQIFCLFLLLFVNKSLTFYMKKWKVFRVERQCHFLAFRVAGVRL